MDTPGAAALIRRLDAHTLVAWPATVTEPGAAGFMLRATPGLDRGRSNNALTPCRALSAAEIELALPAVTRFAARHGIAPGVQVSPAHLHADLTAALDGMGWITHWPTVVMTAGPGRGNGAEARSGAPGQADGGRTGASNELPPLIIEASATPGWVAAWARCEGRPDVAAHASTVFRMLAGRAWFARLGADAVAIGVPGPGLLGLYCIAVAPERRRAGLGRTIVRALQARAPGALGYLQVEQRNTGAIALYERLGFTERYRYCHRVAPD